MMGKMLGGGLLAAVLTVAAGSALAGSTLDAVKARGNLRCGVSVGIAGFSARDSMGEWKGIDVDTCRAVAAALLGDPRKVEFVPLSAQQRFPAIQSGEIDLLAQVTTWTMSRDGGMGLEFAPPNFYDGQGFMVPAKLGVNSAKQLDGATVCVLPGTTTELNLADWFRARKMQFKPVVIEDFDQIEAAYYGGRCDVFTSDASTLAASRSAKAANPADHVILPELISKEPLAPVVRQDDPQFYDAVKWTFYALVEAEERGITAANVDEMAKGQDPAIRRMLTDAALSKPLGMSATWARDAIKATGNYGEIFERNVGRNTPLKLERGVNALWSQGGLMYAMPIR